MKVNHFICDMCGERIEIGDEFKIQITYPIEEQYKSMKTRHHYRKKLTMELCVVCAVERLSLEKED